MEKIAAASLRKATQRERERDVQMTSITTQHTLTEIFWWGMGTESQVSEVSSNKRTRVGCVETT